MKKDRWRNTAEIRSQIFKSARIGQSLCYRSSEGAMDEGSKKIFLEFLPFFWWAGLSLFRSMKFKGLLDIGLFFGSPFEIV